MQPFQAIFADFIKDSTKIIEEFQAQCQAIGYEIPDLDVSKVIPCFKYTPNDSINETLKNASDNDIEIKVIDTTNKSPKELLLSSHFVTKVKNNLEADGLAATKIKIRKVIDKLRSEGKIEFPENTEY
ncbi:hypothetical protein M9Y10_008565 [Tritrichomonas musculus]|uniref:Uncharacterized protein n=1 Tax=Tritrichomonas musculus TaxID=1915356 RepID=A0ABR2IYH9_9EUKA